MELTMNSSLYSSAEISCNSFRLPASSPNAEWIFSQALSGCDDVIRNRQQSVMVNHGAFENGGAIDGKTLAQLLARALRDMSGLSSRGAVLSLTAAHSAIVIESHHPLELPGIGLEIDRAIQQEARNLHVAAELEWDQGRGPRITLTLPPHGGVRRSEKRV